MGHVILLISIIFITTTAADIVAVSAQPVTDQNNPEFSSITINPLVKKPSPAEAGPPAIKLKYFYIERPTGELQFSYERNYERIENLGEEREDTVGEFREGIDLSTTGWLYHPALLSFDLDVFPEWIQTSGDSEYDKNDKGYLNAYSLDADILPFKPYTLRLITKKYQNSFRNTFSERAVIDTDTYGGRLALKYKTLPTILSYSNKKTDYRGSLISSIDQDLYNLATTHSRANSVSQLSANYSDALQTNEGEENRIKTSYNLLSNTYFFEKNLSKKLMSDLIYNWTENNREIETVSFTSSNLRWTERLHWTHKKNLWSDYRLVYQDEQVEGFDTTTKSVDASLQHLLYENLTTRLEGEALRYDYDSGADNVYTGTLDFLYSRSIPWGTLNLTTGLDTLTTYRNSNENWIWVTNEQLTLTTGGVTFLRQENIDPESIRVTNKSGTVIYIRNQDYIIEIDDTLVRIRPTLFGNIKEGQELLASYRYTNISGYDDLVFGRRAGIDVFLWSTLRLSYDYYRRTQEILSGIEPDNPIDETVHKVQIGVKWKWTDTTLYYDDYDTNLASARTIWQIYEKLTFRPAERFVVNFSGYMGNTQFKDSDEEDDFYRVSTEMRWYPAYWYSTGFEAYEQNISGNVQDDTTTGILAFFDLFYGNWTCSFSYRYLDDSYQIRDYKRERDGFLLKISRAFW